MKWVRLRKHETLLPVEGGRWHYHLQKWINSGKSCKSSLADWRLSDYLTGSSLSIHVVKWKWLGGTALNYIYSIIFRRIRWISIINRIPLTSYKITWFGKSTTDKSFQRCLPLPSQILRAFDSPCLPFSQGSWPSVAATFAHESCFNSHWRRVLRLTQVVSQKQALNK